MVFQETKEQEKKPTYSQHTFILPFQFRRKGWKKKPNQTQNTLHLILPFQFRGKGTLKFKDSGSWTRLDDKADIPYFETGTGLNAKNVPNRLLYGHQRYFNGEVRELVYPGKQSQLVENYSYRGKESYYRISYYQDSGKGVSLDYYDLDLAYAMIRYYPSLQSGFLIICTENKAYPKLTDIKKINDYGRRIYNPFLTDNKAACIAPNNLELLEKEALTNRPTDSGYLDRYAIMDAPRYLLETWVDDKVKIFPEEDEPKTETAFLDLLTDERMFVHSMVASKDLEPLIRYSSEFKDKDKGEEKESSYLLDLYAWAYVDKDDATCRSLEMAERLVRQSTYNRWSAYGTVYLATQHSFIALFSQENLSTVVPHLTEGFSSQYLELVLLVYIQRAGFLKFSREAGEMATSSARGILQLQQSYINFKNQFLLLEPSSQEQPIELYQLLQDNLYVTKHIQILDQEIQSLYEMDQVKSSNRMNRVMLLMTVVTILPVSSNELVVYLGTIPLIMRLISLLLLLFLFAFTYYGWSELKRQAGRVFKR